MAETKNPVLGENERQVLINLHSKNGPEAFGGMLNLGEIGVSHPDGADDTERKKNTKLVTPNPEGNIVAFPSEQAVGDLVSGVKNELQNEINKNKVISTDKTITVGVATSAGTELSVNIDGETIIKDADTGELSVASEALTQYVGENAITISEVNDEDNTKTVSLLINSENKVLSQTTTGLDTILKLNYVSRTENSNAFIQLLGIDDEVISEFDATDLVMDGVLESVDLDRSELTFKWNADSEDKETTIDLADYIKPYEKGDGLNLTGQVFSVKIRDNDPYLTVDENGVASKGIDGAIAAAVDALDVEEIGGEGKVITTVSQEDGKISATAIELTASNVKASPVVESGNGTTVQQVLGELSDAIKDVSDAAISVTPGNGIDITTGTSETEKVISAKVKSGDTYIEVTDKGIASKGIDEAISAAINDLDETVSSTATGDSVHVSVTIVETDGKLTSVTVDENDIASATALSAEIDNRKAVDGIIGDVYTANTDTNYISSASSLNDADKKLDKAISTLDGKAITGVTMNSTGMTVTNNVVDLGSVVTGVEGTPTTEGDIETLQCNIKFNKTTGKLDFSQMIIDCGTF